MNCLEIAFNAHKKGGLACDISTKHKAQSASRIDQEQQQADRA